MAAIMNYNGRGDVSSARANTALGAIINVTRTYARIFIRCARALALRAEKWSFFHGAVTEIKVVNHAREF